jgi:chitin synthase
MSSARGTGPVDVERRRTRYEGRGGLGSIGEKRRGVQEPLLAAPKQIVKEPEKKSRGRALSEEFEARGLRRLTRRDKLTKLWVEKRRQGRQLWAETGHQNDDQFTHLRYTCCVSPKPITFTADGYRLQCFEKGYRIKCLHVVTMYNEDDKELMRTLRGTCQNLQHMSKIEGPDVWKKFAVVIVIDGRTKANKETLNYAAANGFFNPDLMEEALGQSDLHPTMHIFEYTAQLKEDENFEKRFPPLQIIFAIKEHNGGKLDSHLWFFNAFADQVIPKYTFLLDVGTQPLPRALFKLYRCMETNDRIAGVCGEIACWNPNYINPVVAAQHFEYKVSHILDKALESSFGFISVLPGAFSAYRYEAIKEKDSKGPLVEYFQSITTPMVELGAFKANMYLAEDRILCFEIVARKDKDWILHYVKNAVAETDTPMTLDVLIRQRRRWLNGSLFASLYTIIHFNRIWQESTHPLRMKLMFTIQFTYYFFNIGTMHTMRSLTPPLSPLLLSPCSSARP